MCACYLRYDIMDSLWLYVCVDTQLSQFLKDMQLRGIVEVKELTQGVDSIVSFDRTHSE